MNKLLICGLVLLSTTATPQTENPLLEDICQEVVMGIDSADNNNKADFVQFLKDNCPKENWVKDIAINDVAYLEMEEPVDLGFEASAYLPENFDAYAAPSDLSGINFIEEEIGLDPAIDTALYLPEGFSPYEVYVNWEAIVYIEEEDLDLGFDTAKYLPVGFDPYASTVSK
ncbi:MAG: hypothetical protein HKN89_08865 [Eudoraea sp.]|nr:hypothetical protein [Eudoraea sp.]